MFLDNVHFLKSLALVFLMAQCALAQADAGPGNSYAVTDSNWSEIQAQMQEMYPELYLDSEHMFQLAPGEPALSKEQRAPERKTLSEIVSTCPVSEKHFHLVNIIGTWYEKAQVSGFPGLMYAKLRSRTGGGVVEVEPENGESTSLYLALYNLPCDVESPAIGDLREAVLEMLEENKDAALSAFVEQSLSEFLSSESDPDRRERLKALADS